MQYQMFSIRDSKAEVFHTPFFKPTKGEAERDFKQAAMDERTMICKHPEDFDLYFVGTYDDNTGKFDSLKSPEHVIKAIHCVQNKQTQTASVKKKKTRLKSVKK